MPRKTNKVKSNKTVLIVVEGQTEFIYFSEMNIFERIPGITILPKTSSHSDIKHVLETALNEFDSGVYDSIWCVFDKDTFEQDNIEGKMTRLLNKILSKGIMIADSMPSFEVWFLSHYQKPKFYYNDQDAVIEELRKYIVDYSKDRKWLERKNLYRLLKQNQAMALANCRTLDELIKDYDERCTCCNVNKLVLEILEEKKNP